MTIDNAIRRFCYSLESRKPGKTAVTWRDKLGGISLRVGEGVVSLPDELSGLDAIRLVLAVAAEQRGTNRKSNICGVKIRRTIGNMVKSMGDRYQYYRSLGLPPELAEELQLSFGQLKSLRKLRQRAREICEENGVSAVDGYRSAWHEFETAEHEAIKDKDEKKPATVVPKMKSFDELQEHKVAFYLGLNGHAASDWKYDMLSVEASQDAYAEVYDALRSLANISPTERKKILKSVEDEIGRDALVRLLDDIKEEKNFV